MKSILIVGKNGLNNIIRCDNFIVERDENNKIKSLTFSGNLKFKGHIQFGIEDFDSIWRKV